MINNQWYAVLSSHVLRAGEMLSARRFGDDVVFFRNAAGEVGCFSGRCPHRGVSIASGCVRDDHIQVRNIGNLHKRNAVKFGMVRKEDGLLSARDQGLLQIRRVQCLVAAPGRASADS